jgi:transcription antitermination factor NusB
MQTLYTIDVVQAPFTETLKTTIETAGLEASLAAFAEELIRGVAQNKQQLDDTLQPLITDWDYDRIAVVDRCILRICAYELFHCPYIPPIVSINEAVEMAKRYSTAESGKFVNGVLGKLLPLSPKANWTPQDLPYEEEVVVMETEEPVETDEVDEVTDTPEDDSDRVGSWKLKSDE